MAVIVDSYPEANGSTNISTSSDPVDGSSAQSFSPSGNYTLASAIFYLRVGGGSPSGNMLAKIYAHTGTYGSTGVPTGAALATSDPINANTLTGTLQLIEFTFTGANKISLTSGTRYFVMLDCAAVGNAVNYVTYRSDNTSPTHAGNLAFFDYTTWSAISTQDMIFYVMGDDATTTSTSSSTSTSTTSTSTSQSTSTSSTSSSTSISTSSTSTSRSTSTSSSTSVSSTSSSTSVSTSTSSTSVSTSSSTSVSTSTSFSTSSTFTSIDYSFVPRMTIQPDGPHMTLHPPRQIVTPIP